MASATERVSILMTPAEKKRVTTKARKAGISVGEYIRRATSKYRNNENDQVMEAMIEQMNQATERAEQAIDDALNYVTESNQRIAKMEAEAHGDAA
jgi:translation initiation factor 2B subunit (eIF-2B alpha/beta/delta family)